MNTSVKSTIELQNIWSLAPTDFTDHALQVFRFQYDNNQVYQTYCKTLKIDPGVVTRLEKIPFLPISFFKTHTITSTLFEPTATFESSGTTGVQTSRHYVKDLGVYRESFSATFRMFYGEPSEWCVIGLLPSYLERNNSSLVVMVDQLVQESHQAESGFYLQDFEKLKEVLQQLELRKQKTLLIGVTFALLDFAELNRLSLQHTVIMETGGMKGRRRELTRAEVHEKLSALGVNKIHSEYGMTELLSQAYSTGDGIFVCPPWMKILVREEDDPFSVHLPGETTISGAVNIIDLANLYSCSFIATDDAAKLYSNESFEILGRLDSSDTRGCSLLSL
ncbi:MAG: acyl transferase [Ferruginibacter sp.]|nr:acyl transferase [Ferruginibacter sp.]